MSMETHAPDNRGTTTALFDTQAQAQQAVERLKDAEFAASSIGIALRDRTAQGEIRHAKDTDAASEIGEDAIDGGILGGLIGLLVGVGALAIPGVGPVVAGGIFSSVLGAASFGAGLGVVGGGVIGSLVHLGMSDAQARYFASGFHAGGVLVTVHAGLRGQKARDILAQAGGDLGTDAMV